jgi:hypothetical protein
LNAARIFLAALLLLTGAAAASIGWHTRNPGLTVTGCALMLAAFLLRANSK